MEIYKSFKKWVRNRQDPHVWNCICAGNGIPDPDFLPCPSCGRDAIPERVVMNRSTTSMNVGHVNNANSAAEVIGSFPIRLDITVLPADPPRTIGSAAYYTRYNQEISSSFTSVTDASNLKSEQEKRMNEVKNKLEKLEAEIEESKKEKINILKNETPSDFYDL